MKVDHRPWVLSRNFDIRWTLTVEVSHDWWYYSPDWWYRSHKRFNTWYCYPGPQLQQLFFWSGPLTQGTLRGQCPIEHRGEFLSVSPNERFSVPSSYFRCTSWLRLTTMPRNRVESEEHLLFAWFSFASLVCPTRKSGKKVHFQRKIIRSLQGSLDRSLRWF